MGPAHGMQSTKSILVCLCSLLEDAREKGANVLELNPANETFETKIPPTILTKVTDEMLVMQEEIFGPILRI